MFSLSSPLQCSVKALGTSQGASTANVSESSARTSNRCSSDRLAGNVSAAELARLDFLDIMSSDYVPASLLQFAFLLRDELGWDVARLVATVSLHHARAIERPWRHRAGLRADLIRVREVSGMPIELVAWGRGERAA